jgi:hypothetical protein
MATISLATYYTVIKDVSPNQYVIVGAPSGLAVTCTDGTGDGAFSFGDAISITDDEGTYEEVYRGFFQGGFVAEDVPGLFYFYTNDTALEMGTTIPVSTDDFVVCFLAGTRIATPAGETPVECLSVGDLVLTADGRTAPVRWVGVQTVVAVFADPLRSFPIRISAGALGDRLPVRDLLVSPDHALFLAGLLVQAGALVNGTTILREAAMPERFTYFHVELDDHALILAEGVPAETFLDTVTRRRFDNASDYVALYGDAGPRLTELRVPRIKSARQVPQALRERLAARAGIGRAAA